MIHSNHGETAPTVLSTAPGQEAIARYLAEAANAVADDPTGDPPDPAPFFEHLDAVPGRLIAGSALASEEFAPARLLCPGGNGECWRERVGSGASARWVWVCNCY